MAHGKAAAVRSLVMCVAVVLGGCVERQPQAPFLCCVLTCTGGLIQSRRDAPVNGDGGWSCAQGAPIDYNSPCSTEDGLECEEDTGMSMMGGESGEGSGSSRGSSTDAASSSAAGSQGSASASN